MPDSSNNLTEFRLFDRTAEYGVLERRLPHWVQARTLAFITFRTVDSMPRDVVHAWRSDRMLWLRSEGLIPDADWASQICQLPSEDHNEFQDRFTQRWHEQLDQCHGACVLGRPELARIVADAFMHFDEDRYLITDFVIMPNHVHVLAAFEDETGMLTQCELWKRFTTREINKRLSHSGRFWQQDGFDHLVRTEQQFDYLRNYIADNPGNAGLTLSPVATYSRDLCSRHSPSDERPELPSNHTTSKN